VARLKVFSRYQILEDNKSVVDRSVTYFGDNYISLNSGSYFSLASGESKEFVLDEQSECVMVESDRPVVTITDNDDVTGMASFTVDTATDMITTSKDIYPYTTQEVTLTTSGTLPTPLAVDTTYYAVSAGTNKLKLSTTINNALADTYIDIIGTGTGNHTLDLTSSYIQNIDDSAQATLFLLENANVKRVTIKNTGTIKSTGYFYAARSAT